MRKKFFPKGTLFPPCTPSLSQSAARSPRTDGWGGVYAPYQFSDDWKSSADPSDLEPTPIRGPNPQPDASQPDGITNGYTNGYTNGHVSDDTEDDEENGTSRMRFWDDLTPEQQARLSREEDKCQPCIDAEAMCFWYIGGPRHPPCYRCAEEMAEHCRVPGA